MFSLRGSSCLIAVMLMLCGRRPGAALDVKFHMMASNLELVEHNLVTVDRDRCVGRLVRIDTDHDGHLKFALPVDG